MRAQSPGEWSPNSLRSVTQPSRQDLDKHASVSSRGGPPLSVVESGCLFPCPDLGLLARLWRSARFSKVRCLGILPPTTTVLTVSGLPVDLASMHPHSLWVPEPTRCPATNGLCGTLRFSHPPLSQCPKSLGLFQPADY